jgi:ADP-ribose pyrophosphatase YjhB (NUDIX family)
MPSRSYPDTPTIGVGVFVFRGDKVLLARRGHEPARGKWSIPGGGVEVGETLRQTALRELAEECGPGLRVDLIGPVAVLDRIARDPDGRVRYHICLVDYLAEYVDGEATAGSDADALMWATLDEIRSLDTTDRLAEFVQAIADRRAKGLVGVLPIEDLG